MFPLLAASLLDPQQLLSTGGLALLTAIIFAETGLLVGFFLPGDSLLFIAGFLSSDAGGNQLPALPIVLVCVFVAAVAGDQAGYVIGARLGPRLYGRPDSRLFKQEHLRKSEAFFERHGSKTIVLARFVPIVRTFTPVVAGASNMRYKTFVTYNVVGALLWAVGLTTLGYFLGQIEIVKNNVEIAVIAIVVISVVPMLVEWLRHRRHAAAEAKAAAATLAVEPGDAAEPAVSD